MCSVSSEYWQGNRRFYLTGSANDGCFTSPWFDGVHPVMLSYGPTSAPWYGKGGSHHGVDIDMPVGTPIRSAVDGVMHRQPSTMGAAYGSNAALIRADGHDYVLGHLSKVLVADGARVRVGQLIGYSGVSGVEDEDGPHLHFEVRPAGGTFKSAVDPWAPLRTSLTSA